MINIFKQYEWIIVTLLATILIIVVLLKKPEPIKVEQVASWKEEPMVIVCPGSPFNYNDAKEVVDNYTKRGHSFYDVIIFDSCPEENIDGWIMIKPADQSVLDNEAGHAETLYDSKTGEILSSIIRIFNSDSILILEHEMGHALGYKHVTRKGHIMYPNLNGIGSNDEGLYLDIKLTE